MKWLKRKILKWLGLDHEIYIGVDWHIPRPSEIVIIKVKNDGTIEVIGDYRSEDRNYLEILRHVQALGKQYRTRNVVHDFPRDPFFR